MIEALKNMFYIGAGAAFLTKEKLEELKALFMEVAEENKALPIGAGLFTPMNPQEQKKSTNTEWTLFDGMTRIPESETPNVRNGNLRAEIEAAAFEDWSEGLPAGAFLDDRELKAVADAAGEPGDARLALRRAVELAPDSPSQAARLVDFTAMVQTLSLDVPARVFRTPRGHRDADETVEHAQVVRPLPVRVGEDRPGAAGKILPQAGRSLPG